MNFAFLENFVFLKVELFKCEPHKMVKHTGIIHRQQPTNCLGVFDHFVRFGA